MCTCCIYVYVLCAVLSCSAMSDSPRPQGLWPNRLLCGILQARILEWVAIPFSRGTFLIQGLNLGLLHCRQITLPSEPPGKPLFICRRVKILWINKCHGKVELTFIFCLLIYLPTCLLSYQIRNVPSINLSVLQIWIHLNVVTTPWHGCSHYPYFIDKESGHRVT